MTEEAKIAAGTICPYCRERPKFFRSSAPFYRGRDFGPLWACVPCSAWVGVHHKTNRPLGRLADAALRRAKMEAHAAFDPIWQKRLERKRAVDPSYKKAMARGGRYKALAAILGIPKERCHIGMFDVELCKRTVEAIRAEQLEA